MENTMLKQLNNVRSCNDLIKIKTMISSNLDRDCVALGRIKLVQNVSQSAIIEMGKDAPVKGGKVAPVTHSEEVPKSAIPSKDTLKNLTQYANIVNGMYAHLDNLRVVKHIAATSFATMKNLDKFLQACDDLLAEATEAISNSLNTISTVAKKHVPEKLKALQAAIQVKFLERITEDMYSAKSKTIQVVPVKDKSGAVTKLLYAINLVFSNFVLTPDKSLGSKGFTYRELCIITTAEIDVATNKVDYYVTIRPEFALPGTYDKGEKISSEDGAIKALLKLVSYYNFNVFLERKPVSLQDHQKNDIKQLKGVYEVRVINDKIVVVLKASVKPEEIITIQSYISVMLRNAYGKDIHPVASQRQISLGNKKTKQPETHTVLSYIFTHDKESKEEKATNKANATKLRILQEELGLDAKQMMEIKKIIRPKE